MITYYLFGFTMLVIISFIIGIFGNYRSIGFYGAFFSSLFFTPILGILFVIASNRNNINKINNIHISLTIFILLLPFIFIFVKNYREDLLYEQEHYLNNIFRKEIIEWNDKYNSENKPNKDDTYFDGEIKYNSNYYKTKRIKIDEFCKNFENKYKNNFDYFVISCAYIDEKYFIEHIKEDTHIYLSKESLDYSIEQSQKLLDLYKTY